MSKLLLVIAIAGTLVASISVADTQTVTVDGRANTVRDPVNAKIQLPCGTVTFSVSASGIAEYAPGRYFSSLLIEYKDGNVSVQRPLAIGGPLEITTSTACYDLNLFFVDDNTSDNSGLVTVVVNSSAFGTRTQDVSPIVNCKSDAFAAELTLHGDPCEVTATGGAYFAAPSNSFRNLLLMYEGELPTRDRHFLAVEVNGPAALMPSFIGGTVKLFFSDSGGIGDNGGSVQASVTCSGPVSVEAASWGRVKSVYQ